MKNSSVELLRRTGCARCEESPAAIVKNAPLVRALIYGEVRATRHVGMISAAHRVMKGIISPAARSRSSTR